MDKKYKYNRPGLENPPWGGISMEVVDPFQNKLLFNESTE
jgi:Glyoxalase superfamily protein